MEAIGTPIFRFKFVVVPDSCSLVVKAYSKSIGGFARVLAATSTAGKHIDDP